MRLIDADALMKLVTVLEVTQLNSLLSDVKCIIRDAPTIEERKHGHWVQVSGWDKNGQAHFDCSACGAGDVHADDVEVPYCWHCGAVMDEEVKE